MLHLKIPNPDPPEILKPAPFVQKTLHPKPLNPRTLQGPSGDLPSPYVDEFLKDRSTKSEQHKVPMKYFRHSVEPWKESLKDPVQGLKLLWEKRGCKAICQ